MSAKDDMQLPEGFNCGDCGRFPWCEKFLQCNPENTRCDWAPSRFTFSIQKARELREAMNIQKAKGLTPKDSVTA